MLKEERTIWELLGDHVVVNFAQNKLNQISFRYINRITKFSILELFLFYVFTFSRSRFFTNFFPSVELF
jgi:hypothetical protein